VQVAELCLGLREDLSCRIVSFNDSWLGPVQELPPPSPSSPREHSEFRPARADMQMIRWVQVRESSLPFRDTFCELATDFELLNGRSFTSEASIVPECRLPDLTMSVTCNAETGWRS
jgi:hypothetical protein